MTTTSKTVLKTKQDKILQENETKKPDLLK